VSRQVFVRCILKKELSPNKNVQICERTSLKCVVPEVPRLAVNVSACTLSNLKLVMHRQKSILECCNTQVHLLSMIEFVGKPAKAIAMGVSNFEFSGSAVCDSPSRHTI